MKKDIHPIYYHDAQVICACGNTFFTGSTKKTIRVEICSACHPFFTGQKRLVDTEGRVERFEKRATKKKVTVKPKKKAKKVEEKPTEEKRVKTLKEMLQEARKKSK